MLRPYNGGDKGKFEQIPMGRENVIYVLRNPELPDRLLIGTMGWIVAWRRRLAAGPLVPAWPDFEGHPQEHMYDDRHPERVRWMWHLACAGMLDGDEAEAAALRDELWPATRHRGAYLPPIYLSPADLVRWQDDDPSATPWRVADERSLARLDADKLDRECTGEECASLKIMGPGKAKPKPAPRPPAKVSSIAERLARRRTKG
jgi:hypothetical protein